MKTVTARAAALAVLAVAATVPIASTASAHTCAIAFKSTTERAWVQRVHDHTDLTCREARYVYRNQPGWRDEMPGNIYRPPRIPGRFTAAMGRGGLLLDEDHQGLGHDSVMSHRLGRFLALHGGHQGIKVGNVHQHGNLGWVLRIDEGSDVRDTEGTKDLLTLVM